MRILFVLLTVAFIVGAAHVAHAIEAVSANDNTALATDRSGTKKQFTAFLDAMNWCYSAGKSAPAP